MLSAMEETPGRLRMIDEPVGEAMAGMAISPRTKYPELKSQLNDFLKEMKESGELDEDENEVIQNIISLDEMQACDAMTPRVVCAIAPESMTLKRFYKDKRFLHHSRIPVFADNDEYITGYILRMEALQLIAENKSEVTLGDIRRDIPAFPEETTLDVIWDEMISKDEPISVIINEYGAFQGILTLEDVIETILGNEIVDERDEVRDMQQLALERYRKRTGSAVSTDNAAAKD